MRVEADARVAQLGRDRVEPRAAAVALDADVRVEVARPARVAPEQRGVVPRDEFTNIRDIKTFNLTDTLKVTLKAAQKSLDAN